MLDPRCSMLDPRCSILDPRYSKCSMLDAQNARCSKCSILDTDKGYSIVLSKFRNIFTLEFWSFLPILYYNPSCYLILRGNYGYPRF
ncbi:MAG: hypothetical protein AB1797_11515 [bacterium]